MLCSGCGCQTFQQQAQQQRRPGGAAEDTWEREQREKLKAWLLPRTDFRFVHEGQSLHVRHWLPPEQGSARGVIFYIHGLNGHINRPSLDSSCKELAENCYAVLSFDQAGNGYSDGLRAYVSDFEDVFKSVLHLVQLVMEGPNHPEDGDNLGLSDAVARHLRKLPFFFFGESMGGMLAMYASIRLSEMSPSWAAQHRGTILIAPALKVDTPPRPVILLLQTIVVPLASTQLMSDMVSSSSKPKTELVCRDAEHVRMCELDDWNRFPGLGLGWQTQMRWATASAFATIYSRIEQDMGLVACPLLVLHDPEDKVCDYEGSQRLMQLCVSSDKKLVDAPNCLHDIRFNDTPWCMAQVLPWLAARCQK